MRVYMCDKCHKQVPFYEYLPIYFDHPSHFSDHSESAGLCPECFDLLKNWLYTEPIQPKKSKKHDVKEAAG